MRDRVLRNVYGSRHTVSVSVCEKDPVSLAELWALGSELLREADGQDPGDIFVAIDVQYERVELDLAKPKQLSCACCGVRASEHAMRVTPGYLPVCIGTNGCQKRTVEYRAKIQR